MEGTIDNHFEAKKIGKALALCLWAQEDRQILSENDLFIVLSPMRNMDLQQRAMYSEAIIEVLTSDKKREEILIEIIEAKEKVLVPDELKPDNL